MNSEDSRQTTTPLDSGEASAILGIEIPHDFYWVLAAKTPLAGMRLPLGDTPWEDLSEIGFSWIVCLCSEHPLYDPNPVQTLVNTELCDLIERDSPEDPDYEERKIGIIADAVVGRLRAGEGVIVHCAGGRGRTGTVLGCVLRELGFGAKEIVEFLDSLNRERGKPGWPEAKWQRDVVECCGSESR